MNSGQYIVVIRDKNGIFDKGKNKLIYIVAEEFLISFIKKELKLISDGNKIYIKGIEKELKGEICLKEIEKK